MPLRSFSHRFLPTTESDRNEILRKCGVNSVEELLVGIPTEVRFRGDLANGPDCSEMEIRKRVQKLTKDGRAATHALSFLGAGVYDHFCPAVVNQLTLRGEFLTSYTPYQPEMSQGTLQALFEFQTMIADIFGMEVSNASHYDGSTSLAEAALMTARLQKEKRVLLVSQGVHPEYLQVMTTYLANVNLSIEIIPLNEGGQTCTKWLKSRLESSNQMVAGVVVQSPNFFGCIENQEQVSTLAKAGGALYIANVTEPLSLGLLRSPGEFEADIATGEGQSFGLPQSYGGPYVGLFTSRMANVRQMPGRLCGETVDAKGRRSYALTLSTREQHIRREKATSNICTNQNLMALWATIWLAMVGKKGFTAMAEQNLAKAEYAKDALLKTGKCSLRYSSPTFNEFTLNLNKSAQEFSNFCVEQGIAPGVVLQRFNATDTSGLLICVTETKSRDEIDQLVSLLQSF